MSIDDKQEKLHRENRLTERITANDSSEKRKLRQESFSIVNKAIINEVEKDLQACEDRLFEYIYKKFTPCKECLSKEEKIRYLAKSYPNRIRDNFLLFKNEFYSAGSKRKSKYPKNGVVGWGVYGFSNSYDNSFSRKDGIMGNKSRGDANPREKTRIERKTRFQPKDSHKRTLNNKRKMGAVKSSPSSLRKEDIVPALNPIEVKDKLNGLDDDIFNIMLLLLGVPKALKKGEKIDFIIDNYKEIRIDAAINYAKKIKP